MICDEVMVSILSNPRDCWLKNKVQGRSSDSLQRRCLPGLRGQWLDIGVFKKQLTAAGLSGIRTRFPFNHCKSEPLRRKITKNP